MLLCADETPLASASTYLRLLSPAGGTRCVLLVLRNIKLCMHGQSFRCCLLENQTSFDHQTRLPRERRTPPHRDGSLPWFRSWSVGSKMKQWCLFAECDQKELLVHRKTPSYSSNVLHHDRSRSRLIAVCDAFHAQHFSAAELKNQRTAGRHGMLETTVTPPRSRGELAPCCE